MNDPELLGCQTSYNKYYVHSILASLCFLIIESHQILMLSQENKIYQSTTSFILDDNHVDSPTINAQKIFSQFSWIDSHLLSILLASQSSIPWEQYPSEVTLNHCCSPLSLSLPGLSMSGQGFQEPLMHNFFGVVCFLLPPSFGYPCLSSLLLFGSSSIG